MNEAVLVAIISGVGTLAGSILGIVASSKLTNYRIAQLEKKVDKHNQVVERTFAIENRLGVMGEQIKVSNHRIADLEACSSAPFKSAF